MHSTRPTRRPLGHGISAIGADERQLLRRPPVGLLHFRREPRYPSLHGRFATAPHNPSPVRADGAPRYSKVEICRARANATAACRQREAAADRCAGDRPSPKGAEPLHWRLLITREIADAAGAWEIVG